MALHITRDVDDFGARAQAFLATEPEHNLLATVLHTVRLGGGYGPEPPLFALFDGDAGRPVAAALRTPPWPMVAAGFDRPERAGALIEAWLELDPDLPGVGGPPPSARALASAYVAYTRGSSELRSKQAMYSLSEVSDPPRPAAGSLRLAAESDLEMLVDWDRDFAADTGFLGGPGRARQNVTRRLQAGFQYVWTTPEGVAVSTVAHNHPIAGTARIGPVYTPPAHRRRGYAATATAAISRLLLSGRACGAAGTTVTRCMLFTDLANPTSNKIYMEIGYVRFGDWEQHRLLAPDTASEQC